MSSSKDKGRYFENMVAKKLTENGIVSERVPLSGSLGGKYASDVIIGSIDHPIARLELKFRESISKLLWEWLSPKEVDYLMIKRSRYEPLVIMTLDQFIELYKGEK